MTNLEKYLSVLSDGEGLLLTSRFSRYYCAQYDIAEGVALVSQNGCCYFTDSRYIESAQKGITDLTVTEMNRENPYSKLINDACERFGVTTLGYEQDYLTVTELNGFQEKLNAALVPMGDKITPFRSVKEPWELALIRKAQQITDAAFAQVLPRVQVGMTEKELMAELIYCLYKNGADGLSFDPIVVSGPNTSMPHGVAGDRKIQEGDFITMDFGAMYRGYCADMTRTVAVGFATEEMEKVYNTVLEAQLAGIAATKAGVTGAEVDGAARKVIADAGYGSYFGHGYGHSIGMECHEMPSCSPGGKTPIAAGTVASAEPGIYLPGKFGVRIEDLVIFTQDGCENITASPKTLLVL